MDGSNISQKLVRAIKLDGGALSKTLERLSAGVNIASSSNNSADVALTSKLSTDSRLYSTAVSNINDAISITNIASEALSALSTILEQQEELAGMAQNPNLSDAKRALIQEESNRLTDNFNKIIETTKVNTIELLNRPQSAVSVQAGISGTGGQIQFDLGLGNAIASSPVDYEYSSPFSDILTNQKLADLNGDGNLDVLGIAENQAIVYIGDGTGDFQREQSMTIDTIEGGKVELADFNGDGNYDLLQLSYFSTVTSRTITDGAAAAIVYFGNGNGSFSAGTTVNSDFIASTSGDFNNDGRADIAGHLWLAGDNQWEDSIVYGNSDGTFTTPSNSFGIAADGKFSSVSANLNGSGGDEVINYYLDGSTSPYSFVSYGGGNPDGPLAILSWLNNRNAGFESNILVNDFNNDGNLDISLTSASNNRLYLGNGNLTFQSSIVTTLPSTYGDTESADLNNDGNIDIVRSDRILFGNGDGTFSQDTTISGGGTNFELGDVNNDGALDIVSNVLRLSHINTLSNTRMSYLNLTNSSIATTASTFVENVSNIIELESGKVAAAQSRLSKASTFAEVMRENHAAAADKVTTIDHAQELANLAATKIRLYASTALLAQVENLYPSVADLLKQ